MGRAVGFFALLLLLAQLLGGSAFAAGRVMVVATGDALRQESARHEAEIFLASLGYRKVAWLNAADLFEGAAILSVVDRASVQPCGGLVRLADWKNRLELAQNRLNMLDFTGSLAELSGLGMEIACLDGVPRSQDLFLLALVTAEAHYLAGAGADAERQAFHDAEARHALGEAASFAPDLPAPAWLDPSMSEQLDRIRAEDASRRTVLVQVSTTAEELWIDGVRVGSGPRRMAPGRHLVQAASGGPLEATAVIDVPRRKDLLLRVAPHERAVHEDDLEVSFENLALGQDPHPLTADLLALLARDDEMLVLAYGADGLRVWGRAASGLQRLGTPETAREQPVVKPPKAPRTPGPRWSVGLGPAIEWSALGGGALEGLGGLGAGGALLFQRSLREPLSVVVTLHPALRVSRIPPGYDATWLVRAVVPARAGLRVGLPRAGLRPELGLDGGLLYLGRFDHDELRGFGAMSLGAVLPLIEGSWARFETFASLGPDFVGGGAQVLLAFGARNAVDEHR